MPGSADQWSLVDVLVVSNILDYHCWSHQSLTVIIRNLKTKLILQNITIFHCSLIHDHLTSIINMISTWSKLSRPRSLRKWDSGVSLLLSILSNRFRTNITLSSRKEIIFFPFSLFYLSPVVDELHVERIRSTVASDLVLERRHWHEAGSDLWPHIVSDHWNPGHSAQRPHH